MLSKSIRVILYSSAKVRFWEECEYALPVSRCNYRENPGEHAAAGLLLIFLPHEQKESREAALRTGLCIVAGFMYPWG